MRVLFGMEQDGAAQARQRAQSPAQGLMLLGHSAFCSSVTAHPTARDGDQRIRGLDNLGQILPPADVVILRLVDVDESESIRRARAAGQVVLFDWDDDVWHLPEHNPAAAWLKRGGRFVVPDHPKRLSLLPQPTPRSIDLDCLEANMRACDAVIASTPALADTIRLVLEDADVYVCRNGIDPALYRFPRRPAEHEPLRLGWVGSVPYLGPALATIAEVLRDACARFPLEFWHLGHNPADPPVEEVLGYDFPAPIERVPWASMREFASNLAYIDAAVVPRIPSAFTEAQSNLTGLSLAAAGVPFVVTATSEYRRLAEAGAGVQAATLEEWARALEVLLGGHRLSQQYRATARARGRELVVEHYGLRVTAAQYLRVFARVARRRAGGVRGGLGA